MIPKIMRNGVSRRSFLRSGAALGVGTLLGAQGSVSRILAAAEREVYRPPFDLAVAKGGTPVQNCLAAVESLGGFGKFVRPGDVVAIKPNPVGAQPPDRAVNTHPEMVEAVVRGCFEVGARRVVVLSHDLPRWFEANGTAAAVERAKGEVLPLQQSDQFREILAPRARIADRIAIASELLDADVFINMPIAKHHAGTRLTLTMKNLMGVNWDRQLFHQTDLHQCIAELASAVRHDLIILDANHVLLTNGPVGPGRVLGARQVVAGIDPVAVDAFATRYFDLEPDRIPHIMAAYDLGVGEVDLARLKIKEFEV